MISRVPAQQVVGPQVAFWELPQRQKNQTIRALPQMEERNSRVVLDSKELKKDLAPANQELTSANQERMGLGYLV